MAEIAGRNPTDSRIDQGPKSGELNRWERLVDSVSAITRTQLLRVATRLFLATGGAIGGGSALSACTPGADNPNRPAGIYSTKASTLTLDQALNVGPGQPIPWTEVGDDIGNYGEMNGKGYLFASRGDDQIAYVECQTSAACLTANVNDVKMVQGLDAAGMAGPYGRPGIYPDQNGINKFIVNPDNLPNQVCDISKNANDTLEVSNCAGAMPAFNAGLSIFPVGGVPHGLFGSGASVKLRNLQTGVTQNTPANGDWASSCGVGFEAGNVVVASQKQTQGGVITCRLVAGPDWQALNNAPIALDSLNNGPNGSSRLTSPRLIGNSHFGYDRYQQMPDGSYPRPWYAPFGPPPQPPEPDAGAPDAGQPIPDANQPDAVVIPPADAGPEVPPIVDAGPAPDAQPDPGDAAGEVADATADAADAAVVIPPEDATPDSGPDLPPAVDAGPDTPPPTPDAGPDTPPDPCSFAKPKVNIQPGCQLANCADPSVDITGKCTFSVDLGKANPVVIELDGTYQVDLLEKIGAHLSGKYKVTDNGNTFNTVAGSFGTGVEGTTYSGEFMVGSNYLLSCQEGTIKVFFIKANGEKELLATLHAGESQTLDMNNPQPEPNPEPTPDAGQPQPEPEKDAGSTQPEPTQDAGPTQPEPTPAIDAGTNPEPETPPVPSKPPSNDGGCSTTGENPNSTGHLATLALALMALGAATRRKREQQALKQKTSTPSSILTRTWNRVARSFKPPI